VDEELLLWTLLLALGLAEGVGQELGRGRLLRVAVGERLQDRRPILLLRVLREVLLLLLLLLLSPAELLARGESCEMANVTGLGTSFTLALSRLNSRVSRPPFEVCRQSYGWKSFCGFLLRGEKEGRAETFSRRYLSH